MGKNEKLKMKQTSKSFCPTTTGLRSYNSSLLVGPKGVPGPYSLWTSCAESLESLATSIGHANLKVTLILTTIPRDWDFLPPRLSHHDCTKNKIPVPYLVYINVATAPDECLVLWIPRLWSSSACFRHDGFFPRRVHLVVHSLMSIGSYFEGRFW